MKAVIMAGGEGTRLRPLTSNRPKPMLPLANRPMMEHIVDLLKRHGIDEIVVTVAFMANAIRTYFGDGSEFGVQMVYATEEQPARHGRLGAQRHGRARRAVPRDLRRRPHRHRPRQDHRLPRGAGARWPPSAWSPSRTRSSSASSSPSEDGSIERFLEKPTWGQVFSDTINTGIFVLEPEIFDYIEPERPGRLLERGLPGAARRPASRSSAPSPRATGRTSARSRPTCGPTRTSSTAGSSVDIPGLRARPRASGSARAPRSTPTPSVEGPAVIGDNCRVEAGARLGEYTVLGANVRVRADADLERCVVHDNAYLGQGVRLRGAVVGRACDLRANVRCDEGVVIGDECFIGEDAVLGAGVKVYPFKTVEAGAVVNSSIVWEIQGRAQPVRPRRRRRPRQRRHHPRAGRQGGHGLRHHAASKGATVVTSPRLVAGRPACSSGRSWPGSTPRASTCSTSRWRRCRSPGSSPASPSPAAGARSACVDGDPPVGGRSGSSTTDGIDITEDAQRKIERLFNREDFRRVFPGEIGDIGFPPRALEHYTAALERHRRPRGRSPAPTFKLVIDYGYGATSFVMPNVLAKLGADVLAVNPYASTVGAMALRRGRRTPARSPTWCRRPAPSSAP